MCRFVFYTGPALSLDLLITRPHHSLVRQSYKAEEREEPLNGDGFGVAWFAAGDPQPATYRSIHPAWSDTNLHHLCRVTRSACVLAHVRAASPGLPVVATNCHPFTSGRFAFMHNGHVAGLRDLKRSLLRSLSDEAFHMIRGTTDSEHVFALFLDRFREVPGDGVEALADALAATVARVVELSQAAGDSPITMNLAVSDGSQAAVCRFARNAQPPSLYVHEGRRYTLKDGVCRMEQPDTGQGAVLVTSEPLSDDPGWEPVPANHVLAIGSDGAVRAQAIT